jgi:hypothetical protein
MVFGNMHPEQSNRNMQERDMPIRQRNGPSVNKETNSYQYNSTHGSGSGATQQDRERKKLRKEKDPIFLYSSLLFTSMTFPFGIMLAFGGRPALLVLCFGAMITYIFDLLGTIEGTLMSILITGLGLWATFVWSARMMLSESVVNFPLIMVMGMILLGIFLIICTHFKSLLFEFETAFYFIEVMLFATIPLMSSVVISWFLCVEIPSLDLSLCFCTTYFLYVLWLGIPRKSSHSNSTSERENGLLYAVPLEVMKMVYLVPVILSPILHIALHHNVLFDSFSRLSGLLIAILTPSLYMLICHERQIGYQTTKDIPKVIKAIGVLKSLCTTLLFVCMQVRVRVKVELRVRLRQC